MTDWRLEVDLGQLNDWRRLAVSMTGDGDFAPALLFVTVSPMQCTTSSVVLQPRASEAGGGMQGMW